MQDGGKYASKRVAKVIAVNYAVLPLSYHGGLVYYATLYCFISYRAIQHSNIGGFEKITEISKKHLTNGFTADIMNTEYVKPMSESSSTRHCMTESCRSV